MKLTKFKLKQIIKEELRKELSDESPPHTDLESRSEGHETAIRFLNNTGFSEGFRKQLDIINQIVNNAVDIRGTGIKNLQTAWGSALAAASTDADRMVVAAMKRIWAGKDTATR
jgi:hypothetical protein